MKMKILTAVISLFLLGCSDSGDSPTDPGNGGGGAGTLSVNDASATEGGVITFTVSLGATATLDVIFDYATAVGSATGGDFTSVNGTDTITVGNISVTIQVSTIDDSDVDKGETFTLTISNPTNATIADATGIATIIDNDISFASDVRPLIQGNNCLNSGCHGTGSSSGGMTLGSATYNNIISAVGNNGAVVVSGNAASSSLYTMLTTSPPFGGRMPATGGFLSTTDINKIRDWINQGANNN